MQPKNTKNRIVRTLAVIAVFALLLAAGWNFLPARIRGHLHFLTPRLTGAVVLCDGTDEKVYRFSAWGDYGSYEWTVGPKDQPVTIRRYNANNWYVTKMDIRVELCGDQWIISGTVNTDGEEPEFISYTIPVGDPIFIYCGGI